MCVVISDNRILHFTLSRKSWQKIVFVQFTYGKRIGRLFSFWQLDFRATTEAHSHQRHCHWHAGSTVASAPVRPLQTHSLQRRSGQRFPCQTRWCVSAWLFSANSWVAASSPAISTAAILRRASSLYCGLWGNLERRLPQFPTPRPPNHQFRNSLVLLGTTSSLYKGRKAMCQFQRVWWWWLKR